MSDTPTLLAQAQQRMAESLAQLPEGKRGAIVGVATTEGARIAVVTKIGQDWALEGFVSKPYEGKVEAGCSVLHTW